MPSNIEQFIEEIVEASKLSSVKKGQLRKELYSDFFAKQRELHLQGFDEQKSLAMIKQSFGNTQIISKELRMVHENLTLKQWFFRGVFIWFLSVFLITLFSELIRCVQIDTSECAEGMLLSFFSPIISHSPVLLFFVALNKFSLFFLGVTAAATFLFYGFISFFKKGVLEANARKRIVVLVFSLALILNWFSIVISLRSISQIPDNKIYYPNDPPPPVLPVEKAGFPLTTFYFPPHPMGNDNVPLYMWPNFYINFSIWFAVSIVAYFFIPLRIKSNNRAIITLAIIAAVLTVYSLGWIILQFD
jgi:hypothetical protein